jgi:single-strand DNA-binding protein
MPAFNRVTLIGNLTRDPETRQLPGHRDSSLTVTEFGLAVNRRFKTAGGEDREDTLYIDCSAFGKVADTIDQYARKGRLLLVEGRLKYETWEDRSGGKRSKISVVVENFQFLGTRETESGIDPAIGVRAAPAARPIGQQSLADAYRERQQQVASGPAEAAPSAAEPGDLVTAVLTADGDRPASPSRRSRLADRKRGNSIPDVTDDSIPF